MGTDIHMMIERKVGAKWVPYPWPNSIVYDDATERYYKLFGLLAGVRGYSFEGMEPRGMPEDFSAPTVRQVMPPEHYTTSREKYLDTPMTDGTLGDHSYSYLTVWEVLQLLAKHPDIGGGFPDVVVPWLRTLGEPDKVRVVFGFDS